MKKLSRNSTEEEVIAVPLPEETDSYSPVPHATVLEIIRNKAKEYGFTLNTPEFLSNKQGTRIIGMFDIHLEDGDPTLGIRLAFRNSYDKSLSFKVVLGSVVFVCSNTCIGGEINYKRKHTGNAIEIITDQIDEAFKLAREVYFDMVKDTKLLKDLVEMDIHEISYLLGILFLHHEILTLTQVGIVERELRGSKNFKHIGEEGFSLFDFYNSCTEALKTSHPNNYIEDHINLHKVLMQHYYSRVYDTMTIDEEAMLDGE